MTCFQIPFISFSTLCSINVFILYSTRSSGMIFSLIHFPQVKLKKSSQGSVEKSMESNRSAASVIQDFVKQCLVSSKIELVRLLQKEIQN